MLAIFGNILAQSSVLSTQSSLLGFAFPLRLEYMTWLQAGALFAALALPVFWLGKRSLNGLGQTRKWVAIVIRLLVLALFVIILAGGRWQQINKNVEVIVLRDISESTAQVHNFPGKTLQSSLDDWLRGVADPKNAEQTDKKGEDRIGVISFHDTPLIDAMPNTRLVLDSRAIRTGGNGTDVAGAIQLALATLGRDAMHRLVLVWDGNQTIGDIESAITSAAAQKVPIDVVPLDYSIQNEVLLERFVAPTWKRENEPFTVDVILRSTNEKPVTGKLTVMHQGVPMDLDPASDDIQPTKLVTLQPGLNIERVRVPQLEGSNVIHQFKAVFEAENVTADIAQGSAIAGTGSAGSATTKPGGADTLLANNTAEAFTFVRGKGKVLYVDNVGEGRGDILRDALKKEQIELEQVPIDQVPNNIVQLQNYDSIILANVPRGPGGLSEEQQKMIAAYCHDMGGGLVTIGGPDAYGAGGWQGSELEKVLPVNMDIPAQRQIPKGALVLVMHSCEMPDGNYWGEQCAIKAVEALSEQDEIGVISYAWNGGGSKWDFPLQKRGDGTRVKAAIKQMQLGDMPSFDDSMNVALNGTKPGEYALGNSDARQKHVIVISDGDPAAPNQGLVQQYLKAKVSVSTVTVYPHTGDADGLPPTMKQMAEMLKGRAYGPINNNPNQLPQIFIKEATVVRRSLIFEDRNGIPLKAALSASDMMKGLEGAALPPLYGLVLTSKKPNPQIDMPIVAGKNNDPVLAHWQTGLGKAASFTSDASNVWSAAWVGSDLYEKFWSQVVRGVSRPPMSNDFDVQTTPVSGNKGKITVEALNKDNAFLNFLNVRGTVIGPDNVGREVRLVQTGPGQYTAEFDAKDPGSYMVMLNYRGAKGEQGVLPSGMVVNTSPELRDLASNDAAIRAIADRTGGKVLAPFDVKDSPLFRRAGLEESASPLPIWDILVPILLALILIDVATRRIAWDWASIKKMGLAGVDRVKGFTTTRKVETRETLDALRRVRDDVAETKFKTQESGAPPTGAKPDRSAKFEAGQGVEGDITKVVGGATDKPMPSAPKGPVQPKGMQSKDEGAGTTGSLLEAKRRARQQMEQREKEGGK